MDFKEISAPVSSDFEDMNDAIRHELDSEVKFIEQVGLHLISSGGKRLRPLVTLLCSKALGYQGSDHVKIATVIEFFHTSTLLHDDVVDNSTLRRGNPTANALWGNAASVLVGDFLLSRAFQLVVNIGHMRLMEVLADATRTIAEGEVMQLTNCKNPEITEADYLKTISYKTAKLFQTAAQSGGIVASATPLQEAGLANYGTHLGNAFQLIDDVLDYTGSANELGKNIGDDLAEGKPTLPLIYVMKNGHENEKALVRNAIKTGNTDSIKEIIEAIKGSGALTYTFKLAQSETDNAIQALHDLKDSVYKDSLIQLAQASLDRCY